MFENVVGHEGPKSILVGDIENSRISHAYAFVGPMGIGKKKLAEEFSKKLLNTDNLNIAIDYKYIKKNEDKKDIVIEQIRKEIVDDIYISPATGNYKVYIIDDAENLNEESQNALLKTLEEPPSYACIILITENIQKFLPTIISRVKQIEFNKLDESQIRKICDINNIQDDFTESMLDYIDGSFGKLIKLKEKDNFELFKVAEDIVKYVKENDQLKLFTCLDKVSLKNTDILDYLQYLMYKEELTSDIFEIENARKKLKYNGNEDIIKTILILNICK